MLDVLTCSIVNSKLLGSFIHRSVPFCGSHVWRRTLNLQQAELFHDPREDFLCWSYELMIKYPIHGSFYGLFGARVTSETAFLFYW